MSVHKISDDIIVERVYEENTRYYDWTNDWTSTIQNSKTTGFDYSGSSHSLSHDLNDAPAGRRFLTSNVGNKIRLLSQGAPTGEASAQMEFDCEEVEVNGPIPASDEMRRDLDLDNDCTSE